VTSLELLHTSFTVVERLGVPLAVGAWVSAFGFVLFMAWVLRRMDTSTARQGAFFIGMLGLGAHLCDFFVTLAITPDLAMEGNPIWRVVIDRTGLPLAKAYGLSGKLLMSLLGAQLFAWHLLHRHTLFPARAEGLVDFVEQLGRGAPRFGNVRSFFAFSFAMFGPYYFYVTGLNLAGATRYELYEQLPSPPVAIVGYFVFVASAYFLTMWRAYLRTQRASGALSAAQENVLLQRGRNLG
jgi:hypothetical protein